MGAHNDLFVIFRWLQNNICCKCLQSSNTTLCPSLSCTWLRANPTKRLAPPLTATRHTHLSVIRGIVLGVKVGAPAIGEARGEVARVPDACGVHSSAQALAQVLLVLPPPPNQPQATETTSAKAWNRVHSRTRSQRLSRTQGGSAARTSPL